MVTIYTTHPDGVYQNAKWRVILSRTGDTLRIDMSLRPDSYLQDGTPSYALSIVMHVFRYNRTDVSVQHFDTTSLYPIPKQRKVGVFHAIYHIKNDVYRPPGCKTQKKLSNSWTKPFFNLNLEAQIPVNAVTEGDRYDFRIDLSSLPTLSRGSEPAFPPVAPPRVRADVYDSVRIGAGSRQDVEQTSPTDSPPVLIFS